MIEWVTFVYEKMSKNNPYLKNNPPLKMDYWFGINAWALILYGALPSILFAFGFLQITTIDIHAPAVAASLKSLSIIPISVLFIVIRQRMVNWYLMSDYLLVRSITITVLILVVSIIVCYSSIIITGKYSIILYDDWRKLEPSVMFIPYLESFLLTVFSIVGSSTLFFFLTKENFGIPGLPDEKEVVSFNDFD